MITTAVQPASQIVEAQGAVSTTPSPGDEFRATFAANVGDTQTQKAQQGDGSTVSDALAAPGALASAKRILSTALLARDAAIARNGIAQSDLRLANGGANEAKNVAGELADPASLTENADSKSGEGSIAETAADAAIEVLGKATDPRAGLPIAKAGREVQLPRSQVAELSTAVDRSEVAAIDAIKGGGSAKASDATPAKAHAKENSNAIAGPTIPAVSSLESLAPIAVAPVIQGVTTATTQAAEVATTQRVAVAQDGIKTAVLPGVSGASDSANGRSGDVGSLRGNSAWTNKSPEAAVTLAASPIEDSGRAQTSASRGSASDLRAALLTAYPLDGENGAVELAASSEGKSNTAASLSATREAVSPDSGGVAASSGVRAESGGGTGVASGGGLRAVSGLDAKLKANTDLYAGVHPGVHPGVPAETQAVPQNGAAATSGSAAALAGAHAQVDMAREVGSVARPLAETSPASSRVAAKNEKPKSVVDSSDAASAIEVSSPQIASSHIAAGSANDSAPALATGEVRIAPALDTASSSIQATVHVASTIGHSDGPERGGASPAQALSGISAAASSEPAAAGAQISESHRTLVATPDTLEVGVPGGTQGWLRIRAQVGDQGGVNASLTTGSTEAREILHSQMPALNAFLHSEHLSVTTSVAERGFVAADGGQAGGTSGRPGSQDGSNASLLQSGSQDGGSSREPRGDPAGGGASDLQRGYEAGRDVDQARGAVSSRALLSEDSGRWLNVRV